MVRSSHFGCLNARRDEVLTSPARTLSLAILSHLYLSLSLASHSQTLLHAPGTTAWTADSLLSQILSARTNLALGPTAKYQEAYYVYEEVKGMQGGRGEATLAGITVAQALLGRWEESLQATTEALEMVRPEHFEWPTRC